ncbi:hypothetical protein V501_07423 [Pseudogymnoascus sp. VKM F-4519 (FW-2642)]|nr:hypothetical protein V501_07423 [Pseudogymnoascus sp. VKM F-4519 (FW-2642)]
MKVFAVILSTVAVVLAAPFPEPTPDGIPSASAAKALLDGLKVNESGSGDGYSRDKFPHWMQAGGACDTRVAVLQRDGENVKVNDACTVESGTWKSPFDGAIWTETGDVNINEMVPLKNAWISGASLWTTLQRTEFANDLVRPQLWAVSAKVDRSKGDRSPDGWKPPRKSFWCTYSKSWVQVKSHYMLTVTDDEKSTLYSMLESC